VAVFTAPDEEVQYVYVADAGNQRVVQLEKDGRFMRQFKPREGEAVSFANLQDIFVDEIGGRLYILDSNNLYVANIPSQLAE
jgi:DNA-binding beta-propeller fold protein YncE